MQKHLIKTLGGAISCFLIFFSSNLLAQNGPKWATNGNTASNGDFIGTTNNLPFILKANNVQALQINTGGSILLNNYGGTMNGLLFTDNTGLLNRLSFTGNSIDILRGDGTWGNLSASTGWTVNGNVIFSNPSFRVGIGTTNPTDMLTVNGNITASGTITATGLNIIQASGVKADSLQGIKSVSASADLYINSLGGAFHTILNAGSTGNVGIGTSTPQAKLDVAGNINSSGNIRAANMFISGTTTFANNIQTAKVSPLPGDSVVHIGDSSMVFTHSNSYFWDVMYGSHSTGIGLTRPKGHESVTLGYNCETSTNAFHAITIGSGIPFSSALVNSTPNSLVIGFNSDIPTVFVGPSAGVGQVGRVGIGTNNPLDAFQVMGGHQAVVFGSLENSSITAGNIYLGFNSSRDNSGNWSTTGGSAFQNNNGGGVIMADIYGDLEFCPLITTGSPTPQNFTDQQLVNKIAMFIRGDGRVVIGPQSLVSGTPQDLSTTLLTVRGTAVCQELWVTPSYWADFVFDKKYKLLSLVDKEDFIQKNKHLPGFPKTEDVMKNGVNTGEMEALLLKEVEELNLYLIELKKENEEIKKQLAELSKK